MDDWMQVPLGKRMAAANKPGGVVRVTLDEFNALRAEHKVERGYMTPYELRILCDIYVGAPIAVDRHTQLYGETLDRLQARGLTKLENADPAVVPVWLPTDKLNALMHHILSTPDPVCTWTIPGAKNG